MSSYRASRSSGCLLDDGGRDVVDEKAGPGASVRDDVDLRVAVAEVATELRHDLQGLVARGDRARRRERPVASVFHGPQEAELCGAGRPRVRCRAEPGLDGPTSRLRRRLAVQADPEVAARAR